VGTAKLYQLNTSNSKRGTQHLNSRIVWICGTDSRVQKFNAQNLESNPTIHQASRTRRASHNRLITNSNHEYESAADVVARK
jgi:hypothetical protein